VLAQRAQKPYREQSFVSVLPVSLWGEAWLTADPFWCLCALPFKPGHRDWQLSDTFLPLPRSESESDLSSGSGSGKDLGSWSPFSVYGFVFVCFGFGRRFSFSSLARSHGSRRVHGLNHTTKK